MKKNIIQLIPFSIALMLVITHMFQILTIPSYIKENGAIVSSRILDSVLSASIGIAITLILILLKQKYWKLFFLGLIILSFTSFIKFYSQTFSIYIGSIGIELTSLGLLTLHFVINSDMFMLLQPSEESKTQQFENSVIRFERKFESKKIEQLQEIVNENSLVPEAVEAARKLISKK